MHILEISSFFPPFGGAFCLEQAKALKARGHEVRILACNELGITVSVARYLMARWTRWEEEMEGVTVCRSNYRAMPRNIRYNQHHWCKTVVSMYHDYVRRYGRPDAIHAHCCHWAGVAARMIAEEVNVPYYITEHLSAIVMERAYGVGWTRHHWARHLLKETYEHATCVIPVSEELVDNLAPYFGREYRYTAISNIIDTDFFAYRDRKPCSGRPYRMCCLAVANIHGKGFDVLAEAMSGMDDIQLHIAGRGTDGKEMKALFGKYGNVTLHGELDKYGVRQLLYDCDALVFPSRCEAQGLVILEALSTGMPVVTTDAIPHNAIIPDACLVAKSGDVGSLRYMMKSVKDIQPSQSYHDAVENIAHRDVVAADIEHIFLTETPDKQR